MTTPREKAEKFRELHAREGAFVLPNPWDAGSARLLEGLGFEALATTSSGFAFTLGRNDGRISLEEALEHCRALSAATSLPVSADLENGFADDPAAVAQTIVRAAEAGAAGGSIEDWSGNAIYDFGLAVERVHAAAEAARALDIPFTLTARAENLIRGRDDLDDTLRRLQAFASAGADVLYAPGLTSLDAVRAVTCAVTMPVNVLAPLVRGATVLELAAAGAKRLSVGGALAMAAAAPILRAARQMLEKGSFDWVSETTSWSDIRPFLK